MKGLRTLALSTTAALLLLSGTQSVYSATTEEIAKGNCKACVSKCEETIKFCISKKDNHANATVVNSLRDCQTSCSMTHDFLARGSAFTKRSAEMCIDALMQCTKSCESFQDNTMKACANECRKTASNLQRVIKDKEKG